MTRITTVQAAAEKNRRSASELARIGRGEEITESAHRLDHVDAQLFADAADENLNGIRIAIEVLVIKVLDEFRARHHAAGMMHEIGEQPIFVRGQLDRITVDSDSAGARIEPHQSAIELALGVPRRA